jgi:xanthine dehydrogenase YagS FAD-binding subunit
MHPFDYISVSDQDEAVARRTATPRSAFLAGGTNLVDDMKLGVENPTALIDVNRLPLDRIDRLPNGGLRIGATARNSDVAYHDFVQKSYPVLSMAILSGASPQLRNAATTAGNLLQRTRCYYFRDVSQPCNKRKPGSGCAAIDGFNRIHAILGTSEKCIATHPSDMDVAMMALDAVVQTQGPGQSRGIAIEDFYVAYGQDPAKETVLEPGELITSVDLPPTPWFARSTYLKVRDRASYEFALSSAAVAMDLSNGVINEIRIALGGVATKPWRARAAENVLRGAKAEPKAFAAAAEAEMQDAIPRRHNAFKVELCKRTMIAALQTVASV